MANKIFLSDILNWMPPSGEEQADAKISTLETSSGEEEAQAINEIHPSPGITNLLESLYPNPFHLKQIYGFYTCHKEDLELSSKKENEKILSSNQPKIEEDSTHSNSSRTLYPVNTSSAKISPDSSLSYDKFRLLHFPMLFGLLNPNSKGRNQPWTQINELRADPSIHPIDRMILKTMEEPKAALVMHVDVQEFPLKISFTSTKRKNTLSHSNYEGKKIKFEERPRSKSSDKAKEVKKKPGSAKSISSAGKPKTNILTKKENPEKTTPEPKVSSDEPPKERHPNESELSVYVTPATSRSADKSDETEKATVAGTGPRTGPADVYEQIEDTLKHYEEVRSTMKSIIDDFLMKETVEPEYMGSIDDFLSLENGNEDLLANDDDFWFFDIDLDTEIPELSIPEEILQLVESHNELGAYAEDEGLVNPPSLNQTLHVEPDPKPGSPLARSRRKRDNRPWSRIEEVKTALDMEEMLDAQRSLENSLSSTENIFSKIEDILKSAKPSPTDTLKSCQDEEIFSLANDNNPVKETLATLCVSPYKKECDPFPVLEISWFMSSSLSCRVVLMCYQSEISDLLLLSKTEMKNISFLAHILQQANVIVSEESSRSECAITTLLSSFQLPVSVSCEIKDTRRDIVMVLSNEDPWLVEQRKVTDLFFGTHKTQQTIERYSENVSCLQTLTFPVERDEENMDVNTSVTEEAQKNSENVSDSETRPVVCYYIGASNSNSSLDGHVKVKVDDERELPVHRTHSTTSLRSEGKCEVMPEGNTDSGMKVIEIVSKGLRTLLKSNLFAELRNYAEEAGILQISEGVSSSVSSFKTSDCSETSRSSNEGPKDGGRSKLSLLNKIFRELETFRKGLTRANTKPGSASKTPSEDKINPQEVVVNSNEIPKELASEGKIIKTTFKGKESTTELMIDLKNLPVSDVNDISVERQKLSTDHTKISVLISKQQQKDCSRSAVYTRRCGAIIKSPSSYCRRRSYDFSDEQSSKTSRRTETDEEDPDDFRSVASSFPSSSEDEAPERRKVIPKKRYRYKKEIVTDDCTSNFFCKLNERYDRSRKKDIVFNTLCTYEKKLEPLKKALTDMEVRVRSMQKTSTESGEKYIERALKLAKMSAGYCQNCGNRSVIPEDPMEYYRNLVPRYDSHYQPSKYYLRNTNTTSSSFYSVSNTDVSEKFCETSRSPSFLTDDVTSITESILKSPSKKMYSRRL